MTQEEQLDLERIKFPFFTQSKTFKNDMQNVIVHHCKNKQNFYQGKTAWNINNHFLEY